MERDLSQYRLIRDIAERDIVKSNVERCIRAQFLFPINQGRTRFAQLFDAPDACLGLLQILELLLNLLNRLGKLIGI
ncbi:hypothetical protein KDH_05480 [Dictyobacter sp. S3.2.2.5]|uniref:Uncharacterized protein n=1 Tax=Dictyobacter halimunensis TaxID=3026934 RepID=A0ABQ6FHX4_9CHLR|nr:hypothetical protein KDH_05480 [Dictyobacter sp. S3.2.2.5]